MIRTFLYFLSISLLAAITTQAQVKDSIRKTATADTTHKLVAKPLPAKVHDSIYTTPGGLRIGLDISRFVVMAFQPYRTDITVQADFQLNKQLYGAIEIGYNRTAHSDTLYNYKGSGQYVTLGVDYDFLKKKEPGEKTMVFGGLRYGFARNTYEVPYYIMRNTYWNSKIEASYPKTSITAHWVELVLGIRVEVLKNFFMGWGVREKIMISNNASKEFPPIIIPGFGSGTKNSQFDVTYSLSYFIPLYKVKIHEPKVTVPKKK